MEMKNIIRGSELNLTVGSGYLKFKLGPITENMFVYEYGNVNVNQLTDSEIHTLVGSSVQTFMEQLEKCLEMQVDDKFSERLDNCMTTISRLNDFLSEPQMPIVITRDT
jgi:hypothetical protein